MKKEIIIYVYMLIAVWQNLASFTGNIAVICFIFPQVRVRESTTPSDSQGEVTLTVERIQGNDGFVNVQWRLNAEAFNDFEEPRSGSLQFAHVRMRVNED